MAKLSDVQLKLRRQRAEEKLKKNESIRLTNEKIFNLLFVEDELSWKDIIFKLIDEAHMDPWDIDVTILSEKFLEMLTKLKELDFRISGKMVLASAILLKMKSDILIEQDIAHFDDMMNAIEENLPIEEMQPIAFTQDGMPLLFPRTPQPRKRKVSMYDLVNALEKALEVENKRLRKHAKLKKIDITIPGKSFDIGKAMIKVYDKIEKHYKSRKTKDKVLTFEDLVMGGSKQDKVLTFVPLLHLDTQRKVDLEQEKHFDTIAVKLAKRSEELH